MLQEIIWMYYLLDPIRGEDIVSGEDNRVEPDFRGEVLPEPIMVSQVIRILNYCIETEVGWLPNIPGVSTACTGCSQSES